MNRKVELTAEEIEIISNSLSHEISLIAGYKQFLNPQQRKYIEDLFVKFCELETSN
jgi:hypothetical protein